MWQNFRMGGDHRAYLGFLESRMFQFSRYPRDEHFSCFDSNVDSKVIPQDLCIKRS